MSAKQKQNIIKRILKHKEAIKTADEAIIGLLEQLPLGEVVPVAGTNYRVDSIFADGASATWRPARIHKYHLVQVHK